MESELVQVDFGVFFTDLDYVDGESWRILER